MLEPPTDSVVPPLVAIVSFSFYKKNDYIFLFIIFSNYVPFEL